MTRSNRSSGASTASMRPETDVDPLGQAGGLGVAAGVLAGGRVQVDGDQPDRQGVRHREGEQPDVAGAGAELERRPRDRRPIAAAPRPSATARRSTAAVAARALVVGDREVPEHHRPPDLWVKIGSCRHAAVRAVTRTALAPG